MLRGQRPLVWKGEFTGKALTMEDSVACEGVPLREWKTPDSDCCGTSGSLLRIIICSFVREKNKFLGFTRSNQGELEESGLLMKYRILCVFYSHKFFSRSLEMDFLW